MLANNIINLLYAYVVGYLPTFAVYTNNTVNNNVTIKKIIDSQAIFITVSETVQVKTTPDIPLYIPKYE